MNCDREKKKKKVEEVKERAKNEAKVSELQGLGGQFFAQLAESLKKKIIIDIVIIPGAWEREVGAGMVDSRVPRSGSP